MPKAVAKDDGEVVVPIAVAARRGVGLVALLDDVVPPEPAEQSGGTAPASAAP